MYRYFEGYSKRDLDYAELDKGARQLRILVPIALILIAISLIKF